jgi:hypothetical protein
MGNGAILGGHGRRSFPQPVCGAPLQSCFVAFLPEPIPESCFRERLPVVAYEEREITHWTCVDHLLKFRKDRELKGDRFASTILLLSELQLSAMHVLSSKPHDVRPSLSGVE